MKFTLGWLKEHLNTTKTTEEIAKTLTSLGLEVDSVIDYSQNFKNFEVAEIVATKPHPNADKLQICTIKTFNLQREVVCGAKNAREGIKVVLASSGHYVPGLDIVLKKAKIRGIESDGMLLSFAELGLEGDSDGIIELPLDTNLEDNIADSLGLDTIFDVEITPNKGHCLGVRGIARELAAAGVGVLKEITVPENLPKSIQTNINIDKNLSNIFTTLEIKNIKQKDTPDYIKKRLKAIGVGVKNNIVDISNYICFDLARPLHFFDLDKISGNISLSKQKLTEFEALDNNKYSSEEELAVICDDKKICAVAGVMGSNSSACDDDTKSILIECAHFDFVEVAKSGRALNINSDARYRFERKIDEDFVISALKLVAKMVQDIYGGEIGECNIVINKPFENKVLAFDIAKAEGIIGVSLDTKKVLDKLISAGFVIDSSQKIWKITIPSYRNDIENEDCIIGEIIKLLGTDILVSKNPKMLIVQNVLSINKQRQIDARNILVSMGFFEVVNMSFIDLQTAEIYGIKEDNLIIINPISKSYEIMRGSLIPSMVLNIEHNTKYGSKNNKFCEIAKIFNNEKGEEMVVSSVISGDIELKSIFGSARKADFFDIKGYCYQLIRNLGQNPEKLAIDSNNLPVYYHPYKAAKISMGEQVIAYLGELHPKFVSNIKNNVVCFEVFLDRIPFAKCKQKQEIELISFMPVIREFAFVLDHGVTAGELVKLCLSCDRVLIKSARIFDIFKDDALGSNKKSLALEVVLQSKEKTLEEQEIEAVSNKIIETVKTKLGGVLRRDF